MKLVKIEWADSYGVSSSWEEISDIKDIKHVCISVGYLALDGDNIKVIVPHISPSNEEIGSCLQGCGNMSIPVQSIIKITELK